MLTTVITSLFGIVTPIMSKVFMDRLLSGQNKDWLMPFIGVMTGLAAIQIIVAWIQTIYSLKINSKMSVIGSKFTLGGLVMFQGLLGAFMSPVVALVGAGQTIQEMRTQMERVEDVMQYPLDRYSLDNADDNTELKKLKGGLELKNISFGYSKLSEPLIDDFSMTINPGGRVAFVGTSGCGKSTLIRLLLGFEKPEKGDIFSNITISATHLTLDDAWEAAEIAGIAEDIRSMPMGMQTVISNGQGGVSGGQKQRLDSHHIRITPES
ncbi:MAG: ATP-binding cassette domain-containing protein [Ruminococcus sp.]|nr:ATP-binding cassette domain-containing protein [Ruminococcus sp.]